MALEINGLTKTFPISGNAFRSQKIVVQALRRVSVSMEKGQSLGLVGESGSGKTTLAKIVAGFLSPDTGSAQLGGTDLLSLTRFDRSKLVQMVFQDPFASLNPKLLLGTQLFEALKIHAPKETISDKAVSLMDEVGLSIKFLQRYPHQLSGGQRQRFAIARALSANPKLLFADEPVSSLDLSVQAQIINLLNRLREEKKFTQVVISHDLAVIANMCQKIVVLKDGEVVEEGETEKILTQPSHPYTKRLLSASPVV